MKKLLVCILVLLLGIGLFGCGDQPSNNKVKKEKADNTETYDEKDPIVLNEDAKYVLVAIKSKYIVVNSEEDFKNLKVAYIGGTDGEAYAKYYDFKETGMYNAPNDMHSGIRGNDFDVCLIDESSIGLYDDWEVVWEMKQ